MYDSVARHVELLWVSSGNAQREGTILGKQKGGHLIITSVTNKIRKSTRNFGSLLGINLGVRCTFIKRMLPQL